jgi:chorismate mutase
MTRVNAVTPAEQSSNAASAISTIPELRQALDEIDARIVTLLASRVAKVAEIAAKKSELALEVRDLEREHEVLTRVEAVARRFQIPPELVRRVFRTILEQSVEHQQALLRPGE